MSVSSDHLNVVERTRIAFTGGVPDRVPVHCWLGLPLIKELGKHGVALKDFFTTTIAPGAYDFRLIAVDRSGNYPPPCEIRLTVQR